MSFHVPELARNTVHPLLKTTSADGNNGAFALESPSHLSRPSQGGSWRSFARHRHEHSRAPTQRLGGRPDRSHHCGSLWAVPTRPPKMRTPNWREMSYVKDLCWDAEDVVIQFHPRKSEYVNNHPHVLHLWRNTRVEMPTPPPELVGVLT